MDRRLSKWIAFFVIFISMTICGLLPIKVANWFNKKGDKGVHYLSVASCFGGGVFFGAYLMHMAPEVRHLLEESLLVPYGIKYPVPELLTAVGFFLLLIIDKIVMLLSKKKNRDTRTQKDNDEIDDNMSVELTYCSLKHTHGIDGIHMLDPSSPRIRTSGMYTSKENIHNHNCEAANSCKIYDKPIYNKPVSDIAKCINNINDTRETPTSDTINLSQNHFKHNKKDIVSYNNFNNHNHNHQRHDYSHQHCCHHHHDHQLLPHHHPVEVNTDTELSARPYMFLVALSVDCIFEGISLGLQTTSSGVWLLVIAILSHETVICFSFGLRILKLFSTRKVIILIVTYASTIPIGCGIGFIIFETAGISNHIDVISGIFLALSSGIFIYVAFFEILNEELTHDSHVSKLVAVTAGFVFMALMVLVDMIGSGEVGVDSDVGIDRYNASVGSSNDTTVSVTSNL